MQDQLHRTRSTVIDRSKPQLLQGMVIREVCEIMSQSYCPYLLLGFGGPRGQRVIILTNVIIPP